ncbi:MAG: hypothetical protein ACI4PJ_03665 [Acutalibacteraceae bacterium]
MNNKYPPAMLVDIYYSKKLNFMLDIKIFKYIMTIYNKFKEVIGMQGESEKWKVLKSEIEQLTPEKFSTKALKNAYKKHVAGFVSGFEKMCDCFKGEKISETTTLQDLSTINTKYTSTVDVFVETYEQTWGFDKNIPVKDIYETIIAFLKCIENVFGEELSSSVKKAYKNMTGKTSGFTGTNIIDGLSRDINLLLKMQKYAKNAYDERNWDSSDPQGDAKSKNENYVKLKKELAVMNKKYGELSSEMEKTINKNIDELVKMEPRMKVVEQIDAGRYKELKCSYDRLIANTGDILKAKECNPCMYVEKFIRNVRKLDKGNLENGNINSVTISKGDAEKRIDLLKGKHLDRIQTTFITDLVSVFGSVVTLAEDVSQKFTNTTELVEKCRARSKQLILQLKANPVAVVALKDDDKNTFRNAVSKYFGDIADRVMPTAKVNSVDDAPSLEFTHFESQIGTEWENSANVTWFIGTIYEWLSLKLIASLTRAIKVATEAQKEANGTMKKKDAENLKFTMDFYGKFATVAAFTGPLVNACPIVAAIWGAIALSGTVVQMVQAAYNHHEAKKTDEARKALLKSQEEAAKRDDKAESEEKQNENPDDTGKAKEKVDTKTDNADVEKLKEKISDLKTINEKLEDQNKKLISENENYKKRVKELEAELAKLKSKNA